MRLQESGKSTDGEESAGDTEAGGSTLEVSRLAGAGVGSTSSSGLGGSRDGAIAGRIGDVGNLRSLGGGDGDVGSLGGDDRDVGSAGGGLGLDDSARAVGDGESGGLSDSVSLRVGHDLSGAGAVGLVLRDGLSLVDGDLAGVDGNIARVDRNLGGVDGDLGGVGRGGGAVNRRRSGRIAVAVGGRGGASGKGNGGDGKTHFDCRY